MAWIESHQSLSRHRKTLKTAGRLSVDRHKLIGHLHELWWWALDNVGVDGKLTDMTPYEIALAAQWDGDHDDFVEALIDGGFIDNEDGCLILHDWYDYAGKLMEQRAKERERSRKRRAEQRRRPQEKDRGSTAGRPEDDREKTVGTVPNRTVPNSTSTSTPPPPSPTPDGVEEGAPAQPQKRQEQPGEQRKRAKTPETTDEQPMMPAKSIKRRAKTPVDDSLFARFWAAYPKKRSKGQAEKAWAKLQPDEQLVETMLAAIERAKTSEEWRKEGGRYIPYPATWLNAKGWEDDYRPLEVINGGRSQKHRGYPQGEDDYSDLIIR